MTAVSGPSCTTGDTTYDVDRVRRDFPILHQKVNGHPLVYLDNAATTQKPLAMIDAVRRHYSQDCANIHRGVHQLSVRSTAQYEQARGKVQRFIGAARSEEIIFVRGTTEGINLVAQTHGRTQLGPGDEILISTMEHHSNIVPWQILCEQTGAVLKVVPIHDDGALDMDAYRKLLGPATRIVAMVHVSNALGTENPVADICALAHEFGAVVVIDGAQAVPHMAVDVRALDVDFYTFSAHKMFGPTAVGVLYGKRDLLEGLPPYQSGGDMISSVTFEKTIYNKLPHRLEAGTPNIAGVIGLGATIDYLEEVGMDRIAAHEQDVLTYATGVLAEIPQVRLIGTAARKASVLSFNVGDVHPHDVGTVLDDMGLAVRTGHHCAQPVMERYAVPATARASFALYNTRAEADALAAGIRQVLEVLG
jgi:cysteine desulfurase/selenocysteine lyase